MKILFLLFVIGHSSLVTYIISPKPEKTSIISFDNMILYSSLVTRHSSPNFTAQKQRVILFLLLVTVYWSLVTGFLLISSEFADDKKACFNLIQSLFFYHLLFFNHLSLRSDVKCDFPDILITTVWYPKQTLASSKAQPKSDHSFANH